MPYSEIEHTDLIILAAEFVGRGVMIPEEVCVALGPDLLSEIQHPETSIDTDEQTRTDY